jgi:hypothetical protein
VPPVIASPIATALAGLIKSYLPAISQADLVKRLKGSCDDVDALNAGKENLLGEGKLNARRALEEADPQPDSEVRLYLIENRGATDANLNNAVEPGKRFRLICCYAVMEIFPPMEPCAFHLQSQCGYQFQYTSAKHSQRRISGVEQRFQHYCACHSQLSIC